MFRFLSKIFRVKKNEVEAKLRPTDACTYGGVGEIEMETWSDGTISLEASLKHTGMPDGTEVDVCFGGRKILALKLSGGYAYQRLQVIDSMTLPAVHVGDPAQFKVQGHVLYKGQFMPD